MPGFKGLAPNKTKYIEKTGKMIQQEIEKSRDRLNTQFTKHIKALFTLLNQDLKGKPFYHLANMIDRDGGVADYYGFRMEWQYTAELEDVDDSTNIKSIKFDPNSVEAYDGPWYGEVHIKLDDGQEAMLQVEVDYDSGY